jgi:hypothetical protein
VQWLLAVAARIRRLAKIRIHSIDAQEVGRELAGLSSQWQIAVDQPGYGQSGQIRQRLAQIKPVYGALLPSDGSVDQNTICINRLYGMYKQIMLSQNIFKKDIQNICCIKIFVLSCGEINQFCYLSTKAVQYDK